MRSRSAGFPGTGSGRTTVVLIVASLTVLAGCLAGVDPATGGDGGASPSHRLVPQGGGPSCDAPLVEGVYAREPDLAADPRDRDRMAAGMMVEVPTAADAPGVPRSDEPLWSGLARTADGGRTWDYATLGGYPGDPDIATSPFVGSWLVGDPVVDFLPDGTLVYMGLMIRADSSTTLFAARYPGDSLQPSEVAIVSRGALPVPMGSVVPMPYQVAYNDKPYMAVDPDTGDVYAAWSWRGNVPGGSRAIPVFARSTDGGRTWSSPEPLVEAGPTYAMGDAFHIGAYPVVGVDGTVHVVWWEADEGVLYHVASDDGGRTFSAPAAIAPAATSLGGPDGVIGGSIPSAAVDRSDGPGRGTVHLTWSRPGDGGDADVVTMASADGGRTWTEPAEVHPAGIDDASHELVPALDVGPDGSVAVLYYRGGNGSDATYHAYMARSADGGTTFTARRVTEEPTDPAEAIDLQPLGDYIGLAHNALGPVGAWQDGRMGSADDPYSEIYACRLEPAMEPATAP